MINILPHVALMVFYICGAGIAWSIFSFKFLDKYENPMAKVKLFSGYGMVINNIKMNVCTNVFKMKL